jgi:ligand-binding SRPBCC domain-containing protein
MPTVSSADHLLCREQVIPRPIDEVFAFFADVRNLEAITPPWLRFRILTPSAPVIRAGARIRYVIRWRAVPIWWTTEIAEWRPPFIFVDTQVRGPYRLWHHTHRFEPAGSGTRMTDEVRYALPFGPLGRALHALWIRRDLEQIFDYRRERIPKLLGVTG